MSDRKHTIHLSFLILMLTFLSLSACGKRSDGRAGSNAGSSPIVNAVAPLFKGIAFSTVTDADKITIAWLPASDDVTPLGDISYEVYASESPDFTPTPTELKKTVIGEKQANITGLSPGTIYHLLVIAVDKEGNKSIERDYVKKTTAEKPVVLSTSTSLSIAEDLGLGIAQVNGAEYQFTGTGTPPAVGSVIVGERENGGYLRRVDSVSFSGNNLLVQTSAASLSDVIEQGRISTTVKLFDVAAVAARNPGLNKASAPGHSRIDWADGLFSAEQKDFSSGQDGILVSRNADTGRYKITVPASGEAIPSGSSPGKSKLTGSVTEEMVADVDISFQPEFITNFQWNLGLFSGPSIDQGEVIARGTLSFDANVMYHFQRPLISQKKCP